MTLIILQPGLATKVTFAGVSVQVADTTMGIHGGVIVNPRQGSDQGLGVAESLYVSLLGPTPPSAGAVGTVELVPGQKFLVPAKTNVWVNSVSPGHKFTAYFTNTLVIQYPPTPVPGDPASDVPGIAAEPGTQPFPPGHVTGLTTVIPSYLYQEYTDDDDMQGWVEAQNIMQQDYVDTFNALNLPIYPGPIVSGKLLDWVGRGLYGMARPVLGSGRANLQGPLNTYGMNWLVPMWDYPNLTFSQGNWQVAANIPNLNPLAIFPQFGEYWTAVTANPTVPETAPSFLPGIGGNLINQGDKILWDSTREVYLQTVAAAVEARFGLNIAVLHGNMNVYLTNDDTYRRILTWHFYKADGNYFSTEFIKRRVWRFLYGADGLSSNYAVDPDGYFPRFSGNTQPGDAFMADRQQISVTLGVNRNVTIRFVMGKRTVGPAPWKAFGSSGGAQLNYYGCNGFNPAFSVPKPWDIGFETGGGITMNDLETSYEQYGPLPFMYIFKQALDLGVLEVPYQFNFTCYIG